MKYSLNNENLYSIVKVCPHAGGVGLCEMVQHLQMWDFTSVSGTKTDRYVEYVDQQHEQFVYPTVVKNAHYIAPMVSRSGKLLMLKKILFFFHLLGGWL